MPWHCEASLTCWPTELATSSISMLEDRARQLEDAEATLTELVIMLSTRIEGMLVQQGQAIASIVAAGGGGSATLTCIGSTGVDG